ncbi:DUF3052 domain-containing protein [Actinosynnema sp. NPDC047251]|uniref:DUF3052 domain-containing protein n=1 Tax=Saccharothrix espanaensis (strain ATCC 51144 / DSM 44229 / JCM 9112 / NBRC 15066 / NRRL 15764) TaxID=1179773 RepID=K0KDN7_SACES|nr:hypothetical protein [Saccharothrix espanaensis]CCH35672.1 hypothetical protein BN6_84570 [Saccharothrix espanaensis DSM 44229]
MTAGYSGKPLHVKLGVRPGCRTLLTAAPAGFALDCDLHRRAGREPYDVQLVFCADLAALVRRWDAAVALMTVAGAVWIAWPKKSSGVATDLGEDAVRDHALAHGLVDVKVCAVDEVWSGLELVRRLKDR